jgi:hypothetical protein
VTVSRSTPWHWLPATPRVSRACTGHIVAVAQCHVGPHVAGSAMVTMLERWEGLQAVPSYVAAERDSLLLGQGRVGRRPHPA